MIQIRDKVKCTGCYACENICPKSCITMKMDKEGFYYPEVDTEKCVNCDLCVHTCPVIAKESAGNSEKNADEAVSTGTGTNKKRAYLLQNKDAKVLKESTSGGAFTPMAEKILSDGGVVYGVVMNKDYLVKHVRISDSKSLRLFRNSKYVQSNLSGIYKQVAEDLKAGRKVVFSGTPCQIEALICFLKDVPDNLILVDVVCRAVPSPGVWKDYIEDVVSKKGHVSGIRFRDKTLGYQYSTMEIKTSSGEVDRGGIESQLWLRMFFSGMIIRPSCTDCKFRDYHRRSDITIWDCFNVHKLAPEMNENVGTTRMIIHTDKGQKLYDDISDNFISKEISVETAVEGVKEMVESPQFNPRRDEFFRDYSQMKEREERTGNKDVKSCDMDNLYVKYFPYTFKVRLKRRGRLILNRMGLDIKVKHLLKKG